MTRIVYIIDSSSLIALNRNNPMDVYPGVWKRIEGLVNDKRIFSPKEVLYEIDQRDDMLSKWSKNHIKMFVDPTLKQMDIVKKILEDHPGILKMDRRFDADPWVIALAVDMSRDPQQVLVEVKRIVVTEEKIRGNRKRIPLICRDYQIEAIDSLAMFRIEGWKF